MTEFYSCDWGTTTFRLRHVRASDGVVLRELREPAGVRSLLPAGNASTAERERIFSSFLLRALDAIGSKPGQAPLLIYISGMASSSVGWREVPYARLPFALDGSSLSVATFELDHERSRARVHLISGVRSEREIMRGEETELIGLFASRSYDAVARGGIVILPGTHSKHVRLRDRRVWDFQTFMTGELFDVLSSHSLLRASVESAGTVPFDHPDSQAAFEQGVLLGRDPGLAASLFQVRTRTVLNGVAPEVNRWFLSGLLIGSEIVTLVSEGNSTPIVLAATEAVAAPYRVALECLELGERLELVPADLMNTASTLGHLSLFRCGIGAS